MRYDAIITLLAPAYAKDSIGQEVATDTERRVFANEFYLSSSEFYAAGQNGLKPERQYQVRTVEYKGEPRLLVDGTEYTIIRTERRGDFTRLTCEKKASSGAVG